MNTKFLKDLCDSKSSDSQIHSANKFNVKDDTIFVDKGKYPYKDKPAGMYGVTCFHIENIQPEITRGFLFYNLKYLYDGICWLVYVDCGIHYLVIDVPPLHIQELKYLKKINYANKRIKKLRFCETLSDHYEEYKYRPGHEGYLELKEKNKKKFADT